MGLLRGLREVAAQRPFVVSASVPLPLCLPSSWSSC